MGAQGYIWTSVLCVSESGRGVGRPQHIDPIGAKNADIVDVRETDKIGLDQFQEEIK